jgi:hypothetical protein
MRFAIIESDQVVNVVLANAGVDESWVESEVGEVGDIYSNGEFSKPPIFHAIAPVSPRQIRQALTRAGLRASVESAVAAGDQDLKDWWEFSTTFERLNPQVTAMGAALGVSDAQLDDLWTLASTL